MVTLGIDASTQGVKALVREAESGVVTASAAVNFGRDLPAFGSPDGFLPNPDPRIRRADPRMWLAALDLVLARLADAFDLSTVAAIGGDGQQHGSVYLNDAWDAALRSEASGTEGAEGLADIFKGVFSRDEAPIWMDSSTAAEVGELNRLFPDLQRRTGSPAIERFTGPQIMKFAAEHPADWERTARVHLVSSFLCSVLAGADSPIDTGDGAGMNLLDLSTGAWASDVCAAVAPDLIAKLPAVCRPDERTALRLSPYFARYGFKPGIPVVPFTGDNPASLVGTGADRPGVAVISLGTSDTFFAALPEFRTDPDGYGHVFGNPSGGFMSLACFKNGSLARNRVREELGVDWNFFDETAFEKPVDLARRAFPYFEPEITPVHAATGIEANFDWERAPADEKVRAVVAGQILNMFERTRWIGDFEVVRVTGGASRSKGIRGAIAAVFGARVETLDVADSAALGGAILAARAILKSSD